MYATTAPALSTSTTGVTLTDLYNETVIDPNPSNATHLAPPTYPAALLDVTATFVFAIAIVGTVGNLLAIVSLLQSTKLRQSPSTAFMINLLACLLPVCAIGLPMFGAACIQMRLWGHVTYSKGVSLGAFTLGLVLSQVHLNTICALAFNRLLAVVLPGTYKRVMRKRVVRLYLVMLWILATLLWLPLAGGIFGRLEFVEAELMVSMKVEGTSRLARMKKAVHVFFTYLLPIMFTAACYTIMYIKVRHSRHSREIRERRTSVATMGVNAVKQWDDHVTRTILVIFAALMVCSVPHVVIHMMHLSQRHPAAWLLLHLVFWLQFCLDPIVYVSVSRQYRKAAVECLHRLCPGLICGAVLEPAVPASRTDPSLTPAHPPRHYHNKVQFSEQVQSLNTG